MESLNDVTVGSTAFAITSRETRSFWTVDSRVIWVQNVSVFVEIAICDLLEQRCNPNFTWNCGKLSRKRFNFMVLQVIRSITNDLSDSKVVLDRLKMTLDQKDHRHQLIARKKNKDLVLTNHWLSEILTTGWDLKRIVPWHSDRKIASSYSKVRSPNIKSVRPQPPHSPDLAPCDFSYAWNWN